MATTYTYSPISFTSFTGNPLNSDDDNTEYLKILDDKFNEVKYEYDTLNKKYDTYNENTGLLYNIGIQRRIVTDIETDNIRREDALSNYTKLIDASINIINYIDTIQKNLTTLTALKDSGITNFIAQLNSAIADINTVETDNNAATKKFAYFVSTAAATGITIGIENDETRRHDDILNKITEIKRNFNAYIDTLNKYLNGDAINNIDSLSNIINTQTTTLNGYDINKILNTIKTKIELLDKNYQINKEVKKVDDKTKSPPAPYIPKNLKEVGDLLRNTGTTIVDTARSIGNIGKIKADFKLLPEQGIFLKDNVTINDFLNDSIYGIYDSEQYINYHHGDTTVSAPALQGHVCFNKSNDIHLILVDPVEDSIKHVLRKLHDCLQKEVMSSSKKFERTPSPVIKCKQSVSVETEVIVAIRDDLYNDTNDKCIIYNKANFLKINRIQIKDIINSINTLRDKINIYHDGLSKLDIPLSVNSGDRTITNYSATDIASGRNFINCETIFNYVIDFLINNGIMRFNSYIEFYNKNISDRRLLMYIFYNINNINVQNNIKNIIFNNIDSINKLPIRCDTNDIVKFASCVYHLIGYFYKNLLDSRYTIDDMKTEYNNWVSSNNSLPNNDDTRISESFLLVNMNIDTYNLLEIIDKTINTDNTFSVYIKDDPTIPLKTKVINVFKMVIRELPIIHHVIDLSPSPAPHPDKIELRNNTTLQNCDNNTIEQWIFDENRAGNLKCQAKISKIILDKTEHTYNYSISKTDTDTEKNKFPELGEYVDKIVLKNIFVDYLDFEKNPGIIDTLFPISNDTAKHSKIVLGTDVPNINKEMIYKNLNMFLSYIIDTDNTDTIKKRIDNIYKEGYFDYGSSKSVWETLFAPAPTTTTKQNQTVTEFNRKIIKIFFINSLSSFNKNQFNPDLKKKFTDTKLNNIVTFINNYKIELLNEIVNDILKSYKPTEDYVKNNYSKDISHYFNVSKKDFIFLNVLSYTVSTKELWNEIGTNYFLTDGLIFICNKTFTNNFTTTDKVDSNDLEKKSYKGQLTKLQRAYWYMLNMYHFYLSGEPIEQNIKLLRSILDQCTKIICEEEKEMHYTGYTKFTIISNNSQINEDDCKYISLRFILPIAPRKIKYTYKFKTDYLDKLKYDTDINDFNTNKSINYLSTTQPNGLYNSIAPPPTPPEYTIFEILSACKQSYSWNILLNMFGVSIDTKKIILYLIIKANIMKVSNYYKDIYDLKYGTANDIIVHSYREHSWVINRAIDSINGITNIDTESYKLDIPLNDCIKYSGIYNQSILDGDTFDYKKDITVKAGALSIPNTFNNQIAEGIQQPKEQTRQLKPYGKFTKKNQKTKF